jgi:hypothetical protein
MLNTALRWRLVAAVFLACHGGLGKLPRAPNAQGYPAPRNASHLLASEPEADLFDRLRADKSIGRLLGGDRLFRSIERRTGRSLKPRKRPPILASLRSQGPDSHDFRARWRRDSEGNCCAAHRSL